MRSHMRTNDCLLLFTLFVYFRFFTFGFTSSTMYLMFLFSSTDVFCFNVCIYIETYDQLQLFITILYNAQEKIDFADFLHFPYHNASSIVSFVLVKNPCSAFIMNSLSCKHKHLSRKRLESFSLNVFPVTNDCSVLTATCKMFAIY